MKAQAMKENTSSTRSGESATLESVSIGDAAKRLRVSVRTVQRRLDKGELQAHQDGETRRVMLPIVTRHDTTNNATERATEGDTLSRDTTRQRATNRATQRDTRDISRSNEGDSTGHDDATGRHDVARHDATHDTTEGDTRQSDSALLIVEKNERIADLRAVVESQKLQIEAANRQAAEATAALREYLKMQKALPEATSSTRHDAVSSRENRQEAPIDAATGKDLSSTRNGAQNAKTREMRPLWKVILGVR